MVDEHEELDAREQFHQVIGAAMASWARVEDAMLSWFISNTEMNEAMARAVFYSATGFQGRADMIKATLRVATLAPVHTQFLKHGVKRARAYATFRNRIAHQQPIFITEESSPLRWQFVLIEGKVRPEEYTPDQNVTTMSDMAVASQNFTKLADLFYDCPHTPGIGTSPTRYLRQVLELPSQADSKTPQRIEPQLRSQIEQLLGSRLE